MANYVPTSACCTTPAIVGPPYIPKGAFTTHLATKTYTTGPEDATKAIFIIYDIFGYSSQILEGADKIAEEGYRVFMPDFWDGKPAPLEWMPIEGAADEAHEGKIDEFCEGPGETKRAVQRVGELQKEFQRLSPAVKAWGVVGYCWGGWIVPFVVGRDSVFKACVQCHPGFPDVNVAEEVSAPLLSLCSKDEPESEFKDFKPALKVDNYFEVFADQEHGWLSARGDLGKERVRQEFDRGYQMMIDWFSKYL